MSKIKDRVAALRALSFFLEDGNYHNESLVINEFIDLIEKEEIEDSKDVRIIAKWLINRNWYG